METDTLNLLELRTQRLLEGKGTLSDFESMILKANQDMASLFHTINELALSAEQKKDQVLEKKLTPVVTAFNEFIENLNWFTDDQFGIIEILPDDAITEL